MSELSSRAIADLKSRAQSIDASLQVGKAGVTDAFAEELKAALKRDQLVKVRFLKSAREATDREEMAVDLASRLGATLVEVRGNTAVYYLPHRRRR